MPENEFRFHPEGQKETKISPETVAQLRDSLGDRLGVSGSFDVRFQIPDSELERSAETVAENIRLLSYLNGHAGSRLRNIIFRAKSEVGQYMAALFQWSTAMAERHESITLDHLHHAPLPLLADAKSPEDLYERLMLAERRPELQSDQYQTELAATAGAAAGVSGASPEWGALTEQILNSDDFSKVERLIRRIGFVPAALYRHKQFEKVLPHRMVGMINDLRNLESGPLEEQARTERAKAINYLFSSGKAVKLRTKSDQVTVDANGIFVQLPGLYTHVPFGLASMEMINALRRDKWLNPEQVQEVLLRHQEANSERSRMEQAQEQQLQGFAKTMGLEYENRETFLMRIAHQAMENPEKIGKTVLEKSAVLPDLLLEHLLCHSGQEGVYAALRMGESVSAELAGQPMTRKTGLLRTYDILNEKKEAYEARYRLLNQPAYYNVTKTARTLLRKPVVSDPAHEFVVLRGDYAKKDGNQHSFLEAVSHGKTARVLLDVGKGLERTHRAHFDELPLFDREWYEWAEDALRTFDYFCTNLLNAEKLLHQQSERKNWRQLFLRYADSLYLFCVSNAIRQYGEFQGKYDLISEHPENFTADQARELLNTFKDVEGRYSRGFYNDLVEKPDRFERRYRKTYSFDMGISQTYLGTEGLMYGLGSLTYNPELKKSGVNVRYVHIPGSYYDEGYIPYHWEARALDTLRIDRKRPLINFIGGFRTYLNQKEYDEQRDPQAVVVKAVIEAAHKQKANVAVPELVPRTGVSIGWQHYHYQLRTKGLRFADKAHVFAVSSSYSMESPEGKDRPSYRFMEGARKADLDCSAPFDTLNISEDRKWSDVMREGTQDLAQSPELRQIAIRQALYFRMSKDQPRVEVAVNGTFYTIAEALQSLRYNFEIFLVKDTGGAAEAAAILLEHYDELDVDGEPEQVYESLRSCLDKYGDAARLKEFFEQDFGIAFDAKPERYFVQNKFTVLRDFLIRFLRKAREHPELIKITSQNELEGDLEQFISSSRAPKED